MGHQRGNFILDRFLFDRLLLDRWCLTVRSLPVRDQSLLDRQLPDRFLQPLRGFKKLLSLTVLLLGHKSRLDETPHQRLKALLFFLYADTLLSEFTALSSEIGLSRDRCDGCGRGGFHAGDRRETSGRVGVMYDLPASLISSGNLQ